MPIAFDTLKKYKDKANVFVETGTHIGITTRMASKLGFRKIYTIELADHFYKKAVEDFKGVPAVEPVFGDSAVELPKLLKIIDEPSLFWLDGHWSDGDTALGPVAVPLYQELEAIAKHRVKDHTILVDDTRLMGGEWKEIELEHVKKLLLEINSDYKLTTEHGYLDPRTKTHRFDNDILVATL